MAKGDWFLLRLHRVYHSALAGLTDEIKEGVYIHILHLVLGLLARDILFICRNIVLNPRGGGIVFGCGHFKIHKVKALF